MQTRNNFSNSVIFNANYLAEPNNLLTHTHTHSNGISLSTRAIAVRLAQVAGRSFQASAKSLQNSLQMLFRVCVTEPVKQEINSSKYNHLNKTKNEEKRYCPKKCVTIISHIFHFV
ncbi:hypothetical protein, partial [Segatella oulorum]|uniref:hypothetical protein n=1 Tax=Segatella oulorum TaxID=28136 RepID=UPI0023F0B385